MSGRYTQINRLHRVYTLIEGSTPGLTATEIFERVKDEYPVTRRSILRDISGLGAAGFPIYEEVDPDDKRIIRWKADRTVKVTKTLLFTPRELVGLYLARQVLTPLRETPFFEDLERAFQKIENVLGEKSLEYLKEISGGLHFEPGPRWGLGIDPEVIDTVRACCEERQLLSVTYQSVNSGETKPRVLGPHFLYFAQGSVYLVAEDIESNRVKVFSLPRMREPKMLDEVYHGEPVDPGKYFEGSLGVFQGGTAEEVVLSFTPIIAPYIRERRWHPSQKAVSNPAGGVQLTLTVARSPELINWILGFGADVKVESPEGLADAISAAAVSIVALYARTKTA